MSSFKKVLLFAVASSLCAFASQAFAVTFFHDEFSPPSEKYGGPEINPEQGDIGGTWAVEEDGIPPQVQELENDENPGECWCQLRDAGADAEAEAWAMLDADDSLKTLNKTVTLTTAIYKDNGNQSQVIALVDGASSEGVDAWLFSVEFQPYGGITYYDPADEGGMSYTFDTVSYTPQSWQNVTLTANMAAKTFTLAVAGHGSDTGSWVGDSHKITGIEFMSGGEDRGYVYMDYVLIDNSSDTLPKPGDANNDGFVDALDAQFLAEHWLMDSGTFWWDGDFNGDEKVDDADAAIMAANWSPALSSASVPEPGTVVMLLAGALLLVFMRRI